MKYAVKDPVTSTRSSCPSTGSRKTSPFFSGVMILTFSTVLVKLIGLLYKIPMLHYLGSEGMGYFNAAYEWYALLCVISTAGLPVASSILIAEARAAGDWERIERLERLSLYVFLILGGVGSLALWLGAGVISDGLGSPDTRYALAAVAPTLLFSCIGSAYRGYFQGYEDMVPTAVSQLIEALGKLVLGLTLALYAWRRGMATPHIAAYAMWGLSLGVGISVIYLVVHRSRYANARETGAAAGIATTDKERGAVGHAPALRRLLSIAVPITVSASVLSLTKIVDMTMILRRLQTIGYDTAGANALYGNYTTMAVPIFNLIPSLISSVALALVPTLSAAIRSGDRETQKTTVRGAIRITALFSLPATLAVAIYSHPILALLFHGEMGAVREAAPLLSLLAISIFFSCLITTTNAILQACGLVRVPILSMLAGSVLKLIGAYILIGIPSLNICGAPISTFLCNAVIVGINLAVIAGRTGMLESVYDSLLRPLLVALPAVGLPALLWGGLMRGGYREIPLFLAAVPLTMVLYLILCLRWNLVGEEEVSMLPRGGAQFIDKIRRRWKRRKNENGGSTPV